YHLANERITQTRQPAGTFRWEDFEITAHNVDEEQLTQLGENAVAAGMLSSRFRYSKPDELADPAGSVVRGISHLDYRWEALDKRIERPRITGEIAADKIGRSRAVTKIDAEWLVRGSCDLQDVRHGGIGTQPRIARHGVGITVRDHKDLAGL